jgi:hypothetical protein
MPNGRATTPATAADPTDTGRDAKEPSAQDSTESKPIGAVVSTAMTPAAALKRHIDWLEYALGAARAEESRRADRLEKASKANREKRTKRLADVREEIDELSALLRGIRELEARAARANPRRRPGTTRAITKASPGRSRSAAAAGA